MEIKLNLKTKTKNYRLKVGETPIIIGRKRPSNYVIDDPMLSSQHCRIFIRNHTLQVEDLESKNGVLLNGIRVVKQRVYVNDVITLGKSHLSIDEKSTNQVFLDKIGYNEGVQRSITLELEKPGLRNFNKDKEQVYSRQNRKLYHGLDHLEKNKNSEKSSSKFKIILALVALALIYFGIQGDSFSFFK